MLLMCTADLPAKAKVANHVQFNGYYGCITCTVMGERIGHTHCYPYDETSTTSVCTSNTLLENSKAAVLTGAKVSVHILCNANINETLHYQVNGRKGIPILALHLPFHLVLGMVIDIMHCVFLGVVKALLYYWFSPTERSHEYSIYSQVSNIMIQLISLFTYMQLLLCDERLLSIAVPNAISRPPKSLLKFTKWKGMMYI